jgi:hypothetical protein
MSFVPGTARAKRIRRGKNPTMTGAKLEGVEALQTKAPRALSLPLSSDFLLPPFVV